MVTASVTFAVGWALKRMFENSVADAAKAGAAEGAQQDVPEHDTAFLKQGSSPAGEGTNEPAE